MLSFPASPTVGLQYTDARGKVWEYDGVKWNIASTAGIKQFFGAKVSLSTDIFLTDVSTAVSWDTEEIDTSEFFSVSTSDEIIIPKTAYYRIHLASYTGQEGNGASYNITLKRNASILADEIMAAYQSGIYDRVLLLEAGDVIKLFASETNNIGRLIIGTYLEIQLAGYTFGSSLIPGFEFSGVKAELQSTISVSSTQNAVEWTSSDIIFNTNANAAGNIYWDTLEPSRFTISTSGYYRLRTYIATGINGSEDSYTITIRKNEAVNVETVTLGGNESVELDETYYFASNDFLQMLHSNTENLGTIEAGQTFFELTRLGV